MKLVFSAVFVRRLREIDAYIAQFNPTAAAAQLRLIRRAVARLRDFPHLGRPAGIEDLRDLKVPGTPYLIRYRPSPERVEMVTLLHERQWREP